MFKTVLVANRGEVAERIRKTCHRMGIRCLALATEADKDLQFLQRFDDVLLLKDRRGYLDMASRDYISTTTDLERHARIKEFRIHSETLKNLIEKKNHLLF